MLIFFSKYGKWVMNKQRVQLNGQGKYILMMLIRWLFIEKICTVFFQIETTSKLYPHEKINQCLTDIFKI